MNHSKGNPSQYRKEFRLILLQVLKVTPTVRCYQNTSVTKRLCPPVAHLPQQVRFCGEFLLKQLKTAEVFMSQVAIQFQHNGSFNEVFCKLPLPVRQNSQQNSVTPNMAKLHPPGNSPSHLPTLNLNPPPPFWTFNLRHVHRPDLRGTRSVRKEFSSRLQGDFTTRGEKNPT